MTDDEAKEVLRFIAALEPKQVVYDRWVGILSQHMSDDKAKRIATELVEDAFAEEGAHVCGG